MRRNDVKRIGVTLLCVAAAGMLVAVLVAFTGGESAATAKKHFCASLANLAGTVTSYEGLDPRTATNDELKSTADDIAGAWERVVDDASDWANADDTALTKAYDDLERAIESLPGDETIVEDLDALEPELDAFPEAYGETFDLSGCA